MESLRPRWQTLTRPGLRSTVLAEETALSENLDLTRLPNAKGRARYQRDTTDAQIRDGLIQRFAVGVGHRHNVSSAPHTRPRCLGLWFAR